MSDRARGPGFVGAGAVAGAAAALAFATVHALVISDIWFSLIPMLIAGALCGATIAWSYGRVFEPSIRSWLGYNASYLVALAVLGVLSIAAFEPTTTMAALFRLSGPPTELIVDALPLTIVFTLGTAATLSILFGRTLAAFGAILVTCVVLVTLLGLDISITGLVQIPTESLYLVLELAGLDVVLAGSYAAVVIVLAWRVFGARADVVGGRDVGGQVGGRG